MRVTGAPAPHGAVHSRRRLASRSAAPLRMRCAAATTVLVAILVVAPSGPAAAQTAGPPDGAAADEPLRMIAQTSDCDEAQELCLWTGDVKIFYQDVTLTCDEVLYNGTTMNLVARGNVVVDQGPNRFTADELHYNLRSKTGLFLNATGYVSPMYSFSGRSIEKLDETRYRVDHAVFTTCGTDDRHPPWSFDLKRALLEVEGYGRFSSSALKIRQVPVFYLPYIVWPIKRERSPGLLMPSFGYSDRFGTYFGLPVYFPLGRSWDTTFVFDYFSNGYYGVGNQLRWAPVQRGAGELDLYTIYNPDRDEPGWEWRINGRHDQADVLGFRLQVQLENLSDPDFFQDFDRNFEANTRRDVYSFAFMSRSWGPYSLNLLADYRTTYFSSSSSSQGRQETVLAQLPELELRVRSNRLAGSDVYWSLVSSVNHFNVDKNADLAGNYWRGDLFPQLTYTLPGPPWLNITPRIGGRYTYYTARYSTVTDPGPPARTYTELTDEPLDRYYLAAGVDINGPSISRIFTRKRGKFSKLKHLIEPRIQYAYLQGTEDTSEIPIADEVDSTPLDNSVRLSLANRLFGRSDESASSREIGSFELFQTYSFTRPLSFGTEGATSNWSPLIASLRLTPNPTAGLDARASYDLLNSQLTSISLTGTGRSSFGSLSLTWYESYIPTSGDRASSQVRTLVNFLKPGFPLSATFHVAYDVEQGEFQQQRYQVGWQGSCWSIMGEYRDLQLGTFPTRDFRIVIELKGVGGLPEIKGSLGPQ
jgi:LPS-assembly protein